MCVKASNHTKLVMSDTVWTHKLVLGMIITNMGQTLLPICTTLDSDVGRKTKDQENRDHYQKLVHTGRIYLDVFPKPFIDLYHVKSSN